MLPFIFLFSVYPLIFAVSVEQQIDVQVDIHALRSGYSVEAHVISFPREKILAAIEEGQVSRVLFELKIYRKTQGLLSLIGDTLIHEFSIAYEAGWDPFMEQYRVTEHFSENGDRNEETSFCEKEAFIRFISTMRPINVPSTIFKEWPDISNYYVLTRITVTEKKLLPPFNLVGVLYAQFKSSSPWVRTDFSEAR